MTSAILLPGTRRERGSGTQSGEHERGEVVSVKDWADNVVKDATLNPAEAYALAACCVVIFTRASHWQTTTEEGKTLEHDNPAARATSMEMIDELKSRAKIRSGAT